MKTKRVMIADKDHVKDEELLEAARILREGGLTAFPTETVYGLGANALDKKAAQKIYEAKGRPSDNPLIVHIADFNDIKPLIEEIPEAGRKLMEAFWPGPLTIIFRKSSLVPYETTGGLNTIAVRMPDDRVANRLIALAGVPVAAPSANTSGRPSPTTADHVWEDMNGKIDMIVDGGPVGIGVESTIVDVTEEIPIVLRPGAVTLEMLQKLLGKVEIDQAVAGPAASDVRPKAPGMKYRHYAPKADMVVVELSEQTRQELKEKRGEIYENLLHNMTDYIEKSGMRPEDYLLAFEVKKLAKKAMDEGHKVGILCTDETKEEYIQETKSFYAVRSIGERAKEETIAHNLYRVLREFDELETDCIIAEGFSRTQLGQAVMNRLTKAAGHKIVNI
ncbi:L-threonylcarbamoyladenylate synthase [Lachnospiraceae bacterium 62-35]